MAFIHLTKAFGTLTVTDGGVSEQIHRPMASWNFLGRMVVKREGKAEKDSGFVSS